MHAFWTCLLLIRMTEDKMRSSVKVSEMLQSLGSTSDLFYRFKVSIMRLQSVKESKHPKSSGHRTLACVTQSPVT
jgi:hypothetical protein